MKNIEQKINDLLVAEQGVLVRRDHRAIGAQLDYALRRGLLRSTLPGVYTAAPPSLEAQIRAAALFRPNAVITGAAAAKVLWWPEVAVPRVEAAVQHPIRPSYPGFSFTQRTVPADLIVYRQDIRLACPALSVLDLIDVLGGAAVDEALRRRATTLRELWAAYAMCPQRPGNGLRKAILHDSRDEPWSPRERTAHQLLRVAGLTGWRTNHPVLVNGVRFIVDLVFVRERIVIEIDGWTYHGSRHAFVEDRWRYARLAAADWTVLPFAGSSIEDDPEEFVAVVRQSLARRRKF